MPTVAEFIEAAIAEGAELLPPAPR